MIMHDFKTQRFFSGVSLLLCAFATLSSSQEVRHTLPEGQSPCPGELIIFTCVTRGSPILAWTSDQYIEQGGTRLEFATFNSEGETRSSPLNTDTVATLTRKAVENGQQVLESQLRITTLPSFPTFSVSCIHIGSGNTNETTLQLLLGGPSEPQNPDSYPTNDNGSCAIHVSWTTPNNTAVGDITRYMVHINDSNILNATGVSKNSSYSVHLVQCALHNITIRAVNRCGQLGVSSPIITVPPPSVTNSEGNSTCAPSRIIYIERCLPWKIAVSVIAPLLSCLLLYLLIHLLCCLIRKKRLQSSK